MKSIFFLDISILILQNKLMQTSAFQNVLKGNIKVFIPKETEKKGYFWLQVEILYYQVVKLLFDLPL